MIKPLVVLIAQFCPTFGDPMDCGLPGSSVHGILQARSLQWIAIPFSKAFSELKKKKKNERERESYISYENHIM